MYFEGNRRCVRLIVFLEVIKKGKEELIIILFNNCNRETHALILLTLLSRGLMNNTLTSRFT